MEISKYQLLNISALYRPIIKGLDTGEANGYVAIPKWHPCFEKNHDEIHEKYDIYVHGGLTFSGYSLINQPKEIEGMWIIGFDTAHFGDNRKMWSVKRVKEEVDRLKNQLDKISNQREQMLDLENFL